MVRWLSIVCLLAAAPAAADGLAPALAGKRYIIELSSSQYDSGYGAYLVPPLDAALKAGGLRSKSGPGADIVVNIVTGSDVGRWVGKGENRRWLYTATVTVGVSPSDYVIPHGGRPAFGVTVSLLTPNSDREDELDCMIRRAVAVALVRYRPRGHLTVDGGACLRR